MDLRIGCVMLVACHTTAAPVDTPKNLAGATGAWFCVELEGACTALDCTGPRSIECSRDGRHFAIPNASDITALGGGRYRYISWHGAEHSLVTVDHQQIKTEPNGAPRPFGAFGRPEFAGHSRDGRIEATLVSTADDNVTELTIRDTVTSTTRGTIELRPPLSLGAHHVFMSADGRVAGVCTHATLHLPSRVIDLPGVSCRDADAQLARVIVRTKTGLAVVSLEHPDHPVALDGYGAAFAGDSVIVARPDRAFSRTDPPKASHMTYVPPSGAPVDLGDIPFIADKIVVSMDLATAVAFREGEPNQPARAFVVALPHGHFIEVAVPPNTMDVEIVPIR